MSEYEKLMLLREAMAYYHGGVKEAFNILTDALYHKGGIVHIYTLELAYKLAEQYKMCFVQTPTMEDGIYQVIDFIKDNEEGEKNV